MCSLKKHLRLCESSRTHSYPIVPEQLALKEPFEDAEFRFPINADDFRPVGTKAIDSLRSVVEAGGMKGWSPEPVNFEGFRIQVDEGGGKRGWLLLRQSLHDPLLVLNVESEVPGGCAKTALRFKCWMARSTCPPPLPHAEDEPTMASFSGCAKRAGTLPSCSPPPHRSRAAASLHRGGACPATNAPTTQVTAAASLLLPLFLSLPQERNSAAFGPVDYSTVEKPFAAGGRWAGFDEACEVVWEPLPRLGGGK